MRVRIATVIDIKTETGAIRHINQIIDVQVVGVINCPNPQLNANVAFIPLDVLQDEAGMMLQGHITELIIRSNNARDDRLPGAQENPEQIQSILIKGMEQKGLTIPPNLMVYGWKSYVSDYIAVSTGDNVSNRIIIILLFIISFIGISNTMLMAILERTKETGMLRSLGMTDGEVLCVYVLEAALIGGLGSCIGILLGCLINIPMVLYGIDYSAMVRELEGDFGYRIVGIFRSTWNLPVILGIGPVATIISGFGAVFPTIRALKLPVTESLRFE